LHGSNSVTDTLLELIDRLPAAAGSRDGGARPSAALEAHGVPSSALPVFAAWLAMRAQRPVVALVSDPKGRSRKQAHGSARTSARSCSPRSKRLPFDRLAPMRKTVRRRLEAVDALGQGKPVVCFTSWAAMTRPTLAPDALTRWSFTLTPGETYSVDDLLPPADHPRLSS